MYIIEDTRWSSGALD